MITRQASCSCGQLHVTCEGEPRSVSLCHCLECQRRTGSAFGIAAFFAREALTVTGDASPFTRGSESGQAVTFHFCPICGSTVYWEPERFADVIALAVGAFADPSFPAPVQSVWESARHDWVTLPPGILRRPEN